MTVRKPSLHARDHLPGGADPLRINLATSKYSNEVINNPEGGLFLYWKLDELGNTTTVAVDSSGNGRAGTFDSDTGAAIDVGVLGLADDTCFTFHRSGHFGHNWDGGPNANVRWSGPYTPTAAISMECWIRTTQAGSSVGCFFNLSGGSTSSPLASLYLDTSGAATFELDSPGASHTVTGSSVVNDGTKHHIVATYDGATMNLYVDGALDGTLAMSLGMHTVSGTLVVVANGREIGSQSWDRGFTGTEDEFAFYTEALLPTTVDTHFLIGQTGTTSVPSGAAGGDLTGAYPDPTLAAIGSAAGPIGSTSVVPVVTIDAKGRVTALTSASPQIDTIGSGTNITTNDVSITKHGLAPKLPNDATKYLDGTGAYTTPGGGGGGGALDVQDYSAGATWTKPAGAHIVEVVILGSGGGGGGGFSSGFGGAGGGGGSVVRVVFKAADLGATEAVTVATGGSAGSGGGGSNGSAGTGSSAFHGVAAFNGGGGVGGGGFGNVQAGGGAGYAGNGAAASAGSPAASGSVGIAGQGGNPPSNSANGGAAESGGGSGAAAGASPFAGGCSLNAGPGGGSGGSGGGSNNGGAGGKSGSTGSGGGGAGGTGGASPTAGTAGANATGGFGGSGGGGGGSASGSGTAGKGGNGGPGGGGGGGGSSSGGTGGNGGTGGAGRVLVITY